MGYLVKSEDFPLLLRDTLQVYYIVKSKERQFCNCRSSYSKGDSFC